MRHTLLLSSFVVPFFCFAQAGTLDPSFGTNGIVNTANSNYATLVAVRPDGRVLSGGTSYQGGDVAFTVVGYTSAGALDASFGNGGTAAFTFQGNSETPFAMALQGDGKVILAGGVQSSIGADFQIALVRFNANGTPDVTFGPAGTGGILMANTGPGDTQAYELVIRPDGLIILAARKGDTTTDLAVYCLNTDGTIHTAFGDNGRVLLDIGDYDQAEGITVDAANMVTVGVKVYDTDYITALAKLSADGIPVVGFGTNGVLVVSQVGFPVLQDLAARPGGGYYVQGAYLVGALEADGSVDTSFGTNGVASAPVTTETASGLCMLVQPDGRIVIGGSTVANGSSNDDHFLARFEETGAVDASFGTGGVARFGDSNADEYTYDMAWSPDGAIVGAGRYVNASFISSYTTYKVRAGGLVGVAEQVGDEVTLFPNPAHDRLIIRSATKSPVVIHDLAGKNIKVPETRTSGGLMLDVSGLATGTYVISMAYPDRIVVERFLKY